MDTCYRCGRPGHWASACERQPCPKCAMPLDWHTNDGRIKCAWRGHPCMTCGQPPHPDNAPGRCERYTHPGDTQADRDMRAWTPWLPMESGELARTPGECYRKPARF